MKVTCLKTNRISNPLGFELSKPHLSYIACDTEAISQTAAQIQVALDEEFGQIVHDSGRSEEIISLAYELPVPLKPRTRYYWRVTVWADNGEVATSEPAWFETARGEEQWAAEWITPKLDKHIHPELGKEFALLKEVKSARAYVCGLGLYELELNGQKAGNEYLTPHFNAYDKWLQYQTYDVTELLQQGANRVNVLLGNGLYKGRFGFEGGQEEIYGDRFALLCEIIITHTDGSTSIITSDDTWTARKSRIVESGIYDGEVYDATLHELGDYGVEKLNLGYELLQARRSLPIIVHEQLKPVQVITTPAGETVLDMGQNMTGWVEFRSSAPSGSEIMLQYGELLQEGNFYRDNLRTAKAEYRYISDGTEQKVRPYFTYYGFRYVKVTGWPSTLDPEDFTGIVLYSDMETTGHIQTSNPLVNRLFLNAMWGQKGNFLDVPTDCPQRDERMGWTGDAQVFAGTASYNMDTFAFFSKYGYDLWQEQRARDGVVPMVVPVTTVNGGGSSAWGDAATVIPWTAYLHSGDTRILEQQFDSMKAWVDHIKRVDDASGGKRLWTEGFHFGDWLALDGEDPASPRGGTETEFISSAYYYHSTLLVAKAANVLHRSREAEFYGALAQEVRAAIQAEYFTPTGRLALNTQTALIVALFMDLTPEKDRTRVAATLRERLKKDKNHLKTGFVGTPYLCRALSETGQTDLAYTLLLNKDYPSWLYAVTLDATTIWERWNSVLPDGTISGTDMNSLNHYAYGSIAEWMYRHMAGIQPVEEQPGFKHVRLAPQPDFRLSYVEATLDSASGRYESRWELTTEGQLRFRFVVPFDARATAVLPDARIENVLVNGQMLAALQLPSVQEHSSVHIELTSGTWELVYQPEVEYIKRCSTEMPLQDLLRVDEARSAVHEIIPQFREMPEATIRQWGTHSLRELIHLPFMNYTEAQLDELEKRVKSLKAISE